MSRPKIDPRGRTAARRILGAAALGILLAGCSDIYLDRRETLGLSAGDAVAANAITQTVDPWPPHSGNNNIAFNGQKMQSAIERYRTNRVIPPVSPITSTLDAAQGQAAAVAAPQLGAAATPTGQ